ncbi:MAG: hypothetical protein QXQ64_06970 [Candidatus Bathyarchaeia archaeon]
MKLVDLRTISVINIGLEWFAEELKKQGVRVTHIKWVPPTALKSDILSILRKIEG